MVQSAFCASWCQGSPVPAAVADGCRSLGNWLPLPLGPLVSLEALSQPELPPLGLAPGGSVVGAAGCGFHELEVGRQCFAVEGGEEFASLVSVEFVRKQLDCPRAVEGGVAQQGLVAVNGVGGCCHWTSGLRHAFVTAQRWANRVLLLTTRVGVEHTPS